MEPEVIECEFIPIKKSLFTDVEETKMGIYSSGIFPAVPDFGTTKWVFSAYLKLNHKKYLDEGWTTKRIIDACLAHLNYMPENKRAKKAQKPKFGNLQPLVSRVTGEYDVRYKDDRLVVRLVTDDRQNPNLWGEGDKLL